MPRITLSKWRGLNAYTDPGMLASGECVVADNTYVDKAGPYRLIDELPEGVKGGDFVSRLGSQGLLAASNVLPHPLVSPLPYVISAGAGTNLLFGCGNLSSTSGGKIYYYAKGSGSAPTEVKIGSTSFNLNTNGIRIERLGTFAYIIDGVNALYRTDTTNGNTTLAGAMNAPTTAPTVALTSLVIDPLTSTTGWASDTFSGAISGGGPALRTIAQNYFYQGGVNVVQKALNAVGNDGGNSSGYYINTDGTRNTGAAQANSVLFGYGANPAIEPANGAEGLPSSYANIGGSNVTSSWMQFDNPGEGFYAVYGTGQYQSPVLSSPNADRTCTQFYVGFYYYQEDTTSTQGLQVSVQAYSDTAATTPIGSPAVQTFIPAYAGQVAGQYKDFVFDLPNLPANPAAIRVFFAGAPTNQATGHGWVYMCMPIFAPIPNGITVSLAPSGGFNLTHAEQTSAYWGKIGSARITKDTHSSPLNWSQYETLLIPLTQSAGSLTLQLFQSGGLSAVLDFRDTISGTHYQTNSMTVATDGAYLQVDISTIPVAILSAIEYFAIVFTSDITTTSTTANMFIMDEIATSGNLPISALANGPSYAPVFYVITEVNALGDETVVDCLESDWSPASASLSPTITQGIIQVSVPPGSPTNLGTTHYRFYRGGGTFTDGYLRLVATCPISANIAYGSDALATDQSNPYISWAYSPGKLTDNTPDSVLFTAAIAEIGRGIPPVGAQAIAPWGGRLWLGVGSTLYASWLIQSGIENGLYFTADNLPNDPDARIKGVTFPVGAADNDPIMALQPMGTNGLLVLKQRSSWLIQGTDPTNFTCQEIYFDRASIGCLAARGVCVVGGTQVWWVASDGIYSYDGTSITFLSLLISTLLNQRSQLGGTPISPSAYQNIAMWAWDKGVYVAAPTGNDTTNSVVYRYDLVTSTWSRYTGTELAFTSGCALTSQTDSNDGYALGYDGQIYQFQDTYDLATSDGSIIPIDMNIQARGLGQDGTDLAAFQTTICTRLYVNGIGYDTPGSIITCVAGIVGDSRTYENERVYTVGASGQVSLDWQVKIPNVSGVLVYPFFSALATSGVVLKRLGVDLVESGIGGR